MAGSAQSNVVSLIERYAVEKSNANALMLPDIKSLQCWKGLSSPIPHNAITWLEFNKRVSIVAHGLIELGIKPGNVVMVYLPISQELYLSLLAIGRIGAVAAFLESWAQEIHLKSCIELTQPKACISHKDQSKFNVPINIAVGMEVPTKAHRFADLEKSGVSAPISPVTDDTTALVTFTTGSSGVPKGANRTHSFLKAQHQALSEAFPYEPNDLDLTAFPVFLLNNLAGGVSTILAAIDLGNPKPNDVEVLAGQILSAKPTCVTLPPSLIWQLSNLCLKTNIQLLSLRRTITGGAPVGPEMIKAYKQIAPDSEFVVLYGSTEAEPIAHIEGKQILEELSGGEEEHPGVCVGIPVGSIKTHIVKITRASIALDENGWKDWDVKSGEVGELLVSGPQVCRDYFRNPEAAIANKVKDGEIVWHRTGDLAYFDGRGRLWIVGRVHNTIQRKGNWYYPVGAEMVIRKLNFVKHAAYIGIPDPEYGEKAVAVFSSFEKLGAEEEKTKKKMIKDSLEANKFPADEVVHMESIPLDPRHHSKIDYQYLKQILQERK